MSNWPEHLAAEKRAARQVTAWVLFAWACWAGSIAWLIISHIGR